MVGRRHGDGEGVDLDLEELALAVVGEIGPESG